MGNLSLAQGYGANGHLAAQTWPQGLQVTFAPNALGQPTQAGTFASGVQYYPNGAVQQFVYGNGIVHQMQQNARQLPARSTGSKMADAFVKAAGSAYEKMNEGVAKSKLGDILGMIGMLSDVQ